MTIKHLVLTGGGPIGFVQYGALKYLATINYINYKNIESIFSTSIGSMLGLIYILNLDWLWVDDFIIKRPWKNVVTLSYINLLYEKGIINRTVVGNALEPLFLAKNIPLTITLLEFYNLTKIEFNIYASNFITLEQKKFNHINTPNIMLLDALYVSLAVPFVFAPLCIEDCLYLDGALIQGCPINNCIAEKQCDHSEIFCFINDKSSPIDLSNAYYINNSNDTNNSNLTNINNISFSKYFYLLLNKWFMKISNIENEIIVRIKNSINVSLSNEGSNIKYWNYILNSDTERYYLIDLGSQQAIKYITKIEKEAEKEAEKDSEKDIKVIDNLLDRKILYLLNIYFKYILFIFYIYFIVFYSIL